MVAVAPIPANTLLWSENAALTVEHRVFFESPDGDWRPSDLRKVELAFEALPRRTQQAALALWRRPASCPENQLGRYYPEDSLGHALRRRFEANAFLAPAHLSPSGCVTTGLFVAAARLNNSCVANCDYVISKSNADDGDYPSQTSISPVLSAARGPTNDLSLACSTVTDIAAGEGLTLSYVDFGLTRLQRQHVFERKWGFQCRCRVCEITSEESDNRRRRYAELATMREALLAPEPDSHGADADLEERLLSQMRRLEEQERAFAVRSS